jgi:glycosyltransferase involved in cell wall biosynthesis
VLPAYNEKQNLRVLVGRLKDVFEKEKINFEIICIIQGVDGTYEEILNLKKRGFRQLKILYFKEPLGAGVAFKVGFSNISKDCDYVLTMDADLNHQPEELPKFLEKIKSADITIGSRYITGGKILGMPLWKQTISRLANKIVSFIFNFPINDKSSGYRIFRREVIADIVNDLKSRNFEVYPEILILARKKGYKMNEIPITFKVRTHGKSKFTWFRTGIGYLRLFFKHM